MVCDLPFVSEQCHEDEVELAVSVIELVAEIDPFEKRPFDNHYYGFVGERVRLVVDETVD